MSVDLRDAASPADLHAAARLHADSIPEGFLSTLGESFLATLYRGISATPQSGVLVAVENGEVLGFISWARDVKICYKAVLKARWADLLWTLLPNAVKPSLYRKVWETLRYPSQHGDTAPAGTGCPNGLRPELLSMAVSARARGKGVGKLLVAAVDAEMARLDLPGYYVVTHAVDERSNGFYTGRGFALVSTYRSHGKPMNEYFKKLD